MKCNNCKREVKEKQVMCECGHKLILEKDEHYSDCATNNRPALPVGECDCRGT